MPSPKKFTSSNYETAFWEAQSFLIAAESISKKIQIVIREEIGKNVFAEKALGLQLAKNVNHAYAVELLLKCVMIIDYNCYYSGHDLHGLFNLLNLNTQDQLILQYEKYEHKRRHKKYFGIWEDVNITMVLEEAGNAFQDLRYLFEGKQTPSYDLDRVVECLEWYIFYIKPELRSLKY